MDKVIIDGVDVSGFERLKKELKNNSDVLIHESEV